jgi:hypothetical protein
MGPPDDRILGEGSPGADVAQACQTDTAVSATCSKTVRHLDSHEITRFSVRLTKALGQ